MRRTSLVIAIWLVWSASARADWQGSTTVMSPAAPEPLSATISGRVGALRMDMSAGRTGQQMSVLVDQRARKAFLLLAAMKAYMEIPFGSPRQGIVCETADAKVCLAKRGFHKTGRERIADHPCTIYETDQTTPDGKTLHVKVWHPDDLAEVPTIRTIVTEGDRVVSKVEITDVHMMHLEDGLFEVPSDYTERRTPVPRKSP